MNWATTRALICQALQTVAGHPPPNMQCRVAPNAISYGGLLQLRRHAATSSATAAMDVTGAFGGDSVPTVERGVRPMSEIPGPRGLPWLGIALDVKENLQNMPQLYSKLYQQYGPLVKYKVLGQDEVLICDPNLVEESYRQEGKFPVRMHMTPWIRYRKERDQDLGLVMQDGTEWWRLRVAAQKKLLHPPTIAGFVPAVYDVTQRLVRYCEEQITLQGGKDRIVQDWMGVLSLFTLEVMSKLVYGKDLGALSVNRAKEADDLTLSLKGVFKTTEKLLFSPPWWRLFKTPLYKEMEFHWQTINNNAEIMVQGRLRELAALKEGEDPEVVDLASYFMAQKELSTKEAITLGLDLAMAGVDTTANLVTFTLANVAQHPNVQARVMEELDRVVGGRDVPITSRHLSQLKYLKACVKETHRHTPIAPSVHRILQEDQVIGGYLVPKGTSVHYVSYVMGKRGDVFGPDPEVFRPDRHLRGAAESEGEVTAKRRKEHPFAHNPFGFGARKCLGAQLATMEAHMALAALMQKYQLEYASLELPGYATGLLAFPKNRVDLQLLLR